MTTAPAPLDCHHCRKRIGRDKRHLVNNNRVFHIRCLTDDTYTPGGGLIICTRLGAHHELGRQSDHDLAG